MAGTVEVNEFVEEIAFLESMFEGTVSAAVIASVIESCDGNVHLAADAIMNFSDEMSTPSQETSERVDIKPVEVMPVLNVDAPPFEYQQPQTTRHQPSTANQQSPALQIPTSARQPSLIPRQPSPSPRQPSSSPRQPPSSPRQPPTTLNQPLANGPLSIAEAIPVSFSEAFRNSGALPKKPPDSKPQKPRYTMKNVWHDQVGKILHYHNQGTRTLIIMRGVSGSGKTHLAKHIVDYTISPSPQNYANHIFSSDNYFMRRGVYQYNRDSLQEAHATNQRNVCEATNKGVSPIIVDNTNTELWEMEPYIRDGVRNGYMIEFVEPNTPWARNANQLERKNIHGVPRENIRRMLDRYDRRVTPESAIKALRLSYPPNKKPPVLRLIPPLSLPGSPRESPKKTNNKDEKDQASNASKVEIISQESSDCPSELHNYINNVAETETSSGNVDGMTDDEHDIKVKKIIEAQKQIEQFEKVEQEWEKGASWDTLEQNNASSQSLAGGVGFISLDPKPPREAENKDTEKPKETTDDDDWSKFMLPWQDSNITNSGTTDETPAQVETISIGTGFEVGDMIEQAHTVLYCFSRDINEGIPQDINNNKAKMSKVITLDKSTSTHDNDFLSQQEVCKNKEYHFRELRRMFRSVPRDSLRDIFESCNFDVNWAVNLVLDSHPESQENDNSDVEISDYEDEPIEECNCLAGYNIVPDMTTKAVRVPETVSQNFTNVTPKKAKRENKLSDNSMQLKRQIENNIMIPDNHYSQHYLNWRRRRENNIERGAGASVSNNANREDVAQSNVSGLDMAENATALPEATHIIYNPTNFRDVAGPSTAHYDLQFMDTDSDTESDSDKSDYFEKTVTINLGREFQAKLDELFGRKGFLYPDNIYPVVNLPMSLLEQINAHWVVSIASQMDNGSRQTGAMIKQDEEFARQLADKEQEMSEEGKEPEVPPLNEIMDMELAYSIYERSVAEWRNNEPQDLAARLSRDKLYNLFPDMSKEVLSEILMAHEYNFKETVESLIISTGQSNWLEDEKGVEKFVMHNEMKRKEKFLEEENKTLDEVEWPSLSSPEKPISLETVNYYRAEAERSLMSRNKNFEKARHYFTTNSPAAASFYSEIAALHTKKYEQASSLAAAYLMKYHVLKNPGQDVLDLHYLRVPEAMVNLDIFLDEIISKLRENNISSKQTWIITGKGLHSVGGPRIKPATKRRLKTRDIKSKQTNGGLLMVELRPSHKMTSELDF